MKKKLFNIVLLVVLITSICGTSVNATEQYALPDNGYIEMPRRDDAVVVETFTEEEMLDMCSTSEKDITSIVNVCEPDRYEPNNTIATAYPYEKTEVLSGNLFIEGYRNSGCHVEGDVDFFSITLEDSYYYDVVLKNLYEHDRHIYIWENKGDGTWIRYKYRYQKAGQPEYWLFKPSHSGTYYIQIAGGGAEYMYFFFAVERMGTINTALWPSEVL